LKRYVEVHRPEKAAERRELGGALVWRDGALAEPDGAVSLTIGLEIVPEDEGVRLTAPSSESGAFSLEGRDCREALVPWGGEVYFDGARLTFLRDAAPRRPNALVLGLAVVVLAVTAVLGLGGLEDSAPGTAEVEAPPLEPAAAKCPDEEPSLAARRAREAERGAEAKRQRYPFDKRDGVEATVLFGEAVACYGQAGEPEAEARARAALAEWTRDLNEDYAGARLRLRVAREHGRHAEALGALRELEALVGHRDGPYLDWLKALRRDLERKAKRSGS
jgi:hypothetical protein